MAPVQKLSFSVAEVAMETSSYFLRATCLDQSPSSADYFEDRSPLLFVTESLKSWIECRSFHVALQPGELSPGFQSSLPLHESKLADVVRDQIRDSHQIDGVSRGLQQSSRKYIDPITIVHEEDLVSFVRVARVTHLGEEDWLMLL